MSKRFQPPKEFGRSTKKPKLDISVNRQLSTVRPATVTSTTSTNNVNNNAGANVGGANNFWDDDDDDVILLATQMAESQQAAAVQQPCPLEITDSELTFTDFGANFPAATSTQYTLPAPAKEVLPNNHMLSQMFADDDDDAFSMCAMPGSSNQHFKKPATPPVKKQPLQQQTQIDAIGHAEELPMTQSEGRRQLSSERQVKFLMERLEALKADNAKLALELGSTKDSMESKAGEAALLRDELRHTRQQMQQLRMEKIMSAEAAKSESKTKIAELTRKVETRETQLQYKSAEYASLKMRHADETRRLEESMRQEALPERASPHERREQQLRLRNCWRLSGVTPECEQHGNVDIFARGSERGTTHKQRTLFQIELEQLQLLLVQLQQRNLQTQQMEQLTQLLLDSVCKVLPECWTYVHSLEFAKHCSIFPYQEHELDKLSTKRSSLLQPNELFAEERALTLRRYVAGLALACAQWPPLAAALLQQRHGELLLLQIIIEAVTKLGFSSELCEHCGLLETFAALLRSLLLHAPVTPENADLLAELLKQLVFTRPSAWVFREFGACLLAAAYRWPRLVAALCVNSTSPAFSSDRVHSVYRFTNDSCVLQVLLLLHSGFL